MSLKTRIGDGGGTGFEAGVTKSNLLKVTPVQISATELTYEKLTLQKYFSEYLRRESDDSRDMTVDGSGTPQQFVLLGEAERCRWITSLRILIEGNNFSVAASGDFRRWGSIATAPGLTNGTSLYVVQSNVTTNIFYDPVRNMGDLFNYQTDYENFINAVTATADYLSVDIAFPVPIVLPAGGEDEIVAQVNDDLVDADFLTFRILARGYQEIIE